MSMKSVTFELPEESLKTLDAIASNLEDDLASVLREAVAMYLADYEALRSELAEGIRQAEAGKTHSHDEVLARHAAWKSSLKVREAA